MKNVIEHIKKMLVAGYKLAKNNKNLDKGVGEINTNGEETIELDKKLEELFIEYIKKNNLPWNIFSEEIGWIKFHTNPEFTIAFDPLDGSANYKFGNGLLPYGTLMAVYQGISPSIAEVVASGAMEFTTGKGYLFDGKETKDFEGIKVEIKNDWVMNQSTPVNFDIYWKKNYELFIPLAEKLHIRWCGSVVGSLMYLLENSSALMGEPCIKPEEVGAVISLVQGAGGKIKGIDEGELLNLKFDSEKKYGLVGGGERLVQFVVERLKSEAKSELI